MVSSTDYTIVRSCGTCQLYYPNWVKSHHRNWACCAPIMGWFDDACRRPTVALRVKWIVALCACRRKDSRGTSVQETSGMDGVFVGVSYRVCTWSRRKGTLDH